MTAATRALPFVLATAIAALVLRTTAGCSSPQPTPADAAPDASADATECPQDLPASCPSPPPSYATDVLPVIERRCWMCHSDGGIEDQLHDFSTYDHIFAQKGPILTQVYGCLMPLLDGGGTPLTPDERKAMLGWLVCGSPNN
jgi:hypothetical protein